MADYAFCDWCLRDDKEIKTDLWCKECCEPICENCVMRHRKKLPLHTILSNHEQTLSLINPEIFRMSKTCPKHSQRSLVIFCSSHDEIICDVFVAEFHKECRPLISIEEASKNVKQSSPFDDLIKRLDNMNHTFAEVLTEFENGRLSLRKQKKEIRQKITNFKNEVLESLDKMENKLLGNLKKKYKKCKNTIKAAKSNIVPKANAIQTWRKDMDSITRSSSNIHIFLLLKYLDGKLLNEEQDIKVTCVTVPSIHFNPSSEHNELSSLGKIDVLTIPIFPHLEASLHQQGQVYLRPKHNQRKPKRISSFDARKSLSNAIIEKGCFVSDDKLLLVNAREKTELILCKLDGTDPKKISIKHPANNVAMYDKDQVLVATSNGLKIVNVNRRNTSQEIVLHPGIYCWSVTSLNGKIAVFMEKKTVCITDISGEVSKTIQTCVHADDVALDARDNIYFSESYGNHIYVTSVNEKGSIFYEASDLKGNIAADNDGNIFLAQTGSNDVSKVYYNNRVPEVVLSSDDDVFLPNILSYNTERNELLLINTINHIIQIYEM